MTNSENPTTNFLNFSTSLLSLASDVSTPSLLPKTGAMLSYAAGCGARVVITDRNFLSEEQPASVGSVKGARESLRRARSLFALFGNSSCDGYPWGKGAEEMSANTSFELCHTIDSAAHIMAKLESTSHLAETSKADALATLKHGLACALYFERHLALDGQEPPRTAAGFMAHMGASLQTWAMVFGLDEEKARSKVSKLEEGDLFELMNECPRVQPTKPQGPQALELADVHEFYVSQGLKFQMQSQFTLVHDSGLRVLGKAVMVKAVKLGESDSPLLAFSSELFTLPPVGTPERTAAMEWMLEEQGRCADHVKILLHESAGVAQCLVRAKVDWPTETDEIPSLRGFVGLLSLLLDRGGEFGLSQAA